MTKALRVVIPSAVLLVMACTSSSQHRRPGSGASASHEAERAALTIPPGPDTVAALARLDEAAKAGNNAAGWLRVHYLTDLFDDVRARQDPETRKTLAQALGHSSPESLRGTQATDQVLSALLIEVDRILAADRLHRNAGAARTLLEFDSQPRPTDRDALFRAIAAIKAVARSGGPMAANASLRLFFYCSRAMGDATTRPWRQRVVVLSHCLYPLYETDPQPYFASTADLRPPPPDWFTLVDELAAMLAAPWPGRLELSRKSVLSQLEQFRRTNERSLPRPLDARALGLPSTSERVALYDFTPLLNLGNGTDKSALEQGKQGLSEAVHGDGRARVAVALAAQAASTGLLEAAKVASKAGATELDLLVATRQRLDVPRGDYWSRRAQSGSIERVGALRVALAETLAGPGTGAKDRVTTSDASAPPDAGWQPTAARLRVHLVVSADTWRLVAPRGQIVVVKASEEPARVISTTLSRLRSAYPDEHGLFVVPGPNATMSALVSAIIAATTAAGGAPTMTRIALSTNAPRPVRRDLKRAIDRRAPASVVIEPGALMPRASQLRGCYQDLLEKQPKLAGEFRVELAGGAARVTQGPNNKHLRRCVLDAIGPTMAASGVASATARLSITAPPK